MTVCTTLNAIRKHSPCESGWIKLLKHLGKSKSDGKSLPLSVILESNGIEDAIWCLRCLPKKYEKRIRYFNCDIAEHVLPIFESKYPEDKRPREAIQAGRDFADGKITDAAWDAARDAAWDAARDAAWDAAWDAARAAERKWQSQLFIKYFGGAA